MNRGLLTSIMPALALPAASIILLLATLSVHAVPWTPENSDKPVAWFDAQDATTIHTNDASGRVSQWDDKSGNTNHAPQLTPGDQLYYTSSDSRMNGYAAVYNDSLVRKYVVTPEISVAQVYAVCAYANTVTNRFDGHRALCNSADNSMKIQGNSNDENWNGMGATTFYETFPYKNGETNATELALPMTVTMWRFSRTSTTSTVWRIMGGSGTSGQFWEGPVGEMIFTDGTESLEEQQQFEGYLAWKWGLEDDLPGYHPWKNEAPFLGDKGTLIILR